MRADHDDSPATGGQGGHSKSFNMPHAPPRLVELSADLGIDFAKGSGPGAWQHRSGVAECSGHKWILVTLHKKRYCLTKKCHDILYLHTLENNFHKRSKNALKNSSAKILASTRSTGWAGWIAEIQNYSDLP